MPCYFVSSGVEIPMTNETFDSIWNGFGNKELTDSETVFHRKKAMKQFHQSKNPKKPNGESRTAGRRILQQKTEGRNVFPKILPRENETTVCMRYMRLCHELRVKLGKTQENQKVPEVLGLSSQCF